MNSLLHRLLFSMATIACLLGQDATPPARMAPDAHPSFEVAAIKPQEQDPRRQGFSAHGQRFTIRGQSVTTLMQFAYAVHPGQIVDAPEWALHDWYEIDGKTDTPGDPSFAQQQEMLRKLLADRFGLRIRREKRDLPVYAIQISRGGSKLKPAAAPDAQGDQRASSRGKELTQLYTSVTMADFIMGMQFFLDRPLVDQTGLKGKYDIELRYNSDELSASEPGAAPSLFTAVQEQLGLRLESVKAPVDVLAIERVDRPSEN